VVELAGFFFKSDFSPASAEDLVPKKMTAEETKSLFEKSIEKFDQVTEWNTEKLHEAGVQLVADTGLKNGQVFSALRVAVTGQTVSTPTFETMEILGKDESFKRIRLAIEAL
jgi:glutamyl-tRNA synthetase